EWVRGLESVTADEAARRFGPINPIAWMIGHLAWQEQLYWLERAQGQTVVPEVKAFGYGKPLSVPALDEAWTWWRAVTTAADPYLEDLAEIGRASCRERGEISVGGGSIERNEARRDVTG